jgi:hypothetical protein
MLRRARRLIPITLLALAPLLFGADVEKTNVPDEKVLPADKAPSDAPLQPMKGLTLYKLTDLRVTGTELTVHYVAVSGTAGRDGPGLVLRFPDGKELFTISARELASRTKSGKMIDFPKGKSKGKGGPAPGPTNAGEITVDAKGLKGGLPKNLEVYAVHVDRGLERAGLMSRFKVSNSVIVGKMDVPRQFAREWKEDELKKLGEPAAAPTPPGKVAGGGDVPLPNPSKTLGTDSNFAGSILGTTLLTHRYADADKRPVTGVMYQAREALIKGGARINCITSFTPIYQAGRARAGQTLEMAKDGYVVGGLNVKFRTVVTGVQVVYMKRKPDGSLDPEDTYKSEWLGQPGEADKEYALTGKGKKVIGVHLKSAVGKLQAVALVLE